MAWKKLNHNWALLSYFQMRKSRRHKFKTLRFLKRKKKMTNSLTCRNISRRCLTSMVLLKRDLILKLSSPVRKRRPNSSKRSKRWLKRINLLVDLLKTNFGKVLRVAIAQSYLPHFGQLKLLWRLLVLNRPSPSSQSLEPPFSRLCLEMQWS